MRSRSYQFGIFALLILTAAAAGSFAVIRLALPLGAKIVMVQSIAVCFVGWALRNHKYSDPRLPQKALTTGQWLIAVIPAVAMIIVLSLLQVMLHFKIIVP